MSGIFCMMSLRTRGTSPKKKRAKTPATTPNPAAVAPLVEELANDGREVLKLEAHVLGRTNLPKEH